MGDIQLTNVRGFGGTTLSIPFSLTFATAGSVTTVEGSIFLQPTTGGYMPNPDGTLVSISPAAPQLQPGLPLPERSRFAGFADPFRGGVYVG